MRERLVYSDADNPWVSVYFDEVRFPDGRPGRYNRVVEGHGRPGVLVLPITPAGVLLLRIFRYPINAWMIEAPRGFGESDEPRVDAMRELREETGLSAGHLFPLGVLHPNSGLLSGAVHAFAAVIDESPPSPRDDEADALIVLPWNDALNAATDGRISDCLTIAALFRADRHGELLGRLGVSS